ncbi:MAG: amidohydrolase family protein [Anaerolineae bacterium]
MADIAYWDCNVSFGNPPADILKPCPTVNELLQELDWHGVSGALVHHALMVSQSPVVGNAALVQKLAGQTRLVGTWAILPPQTGELPRGSAFFQDMAQNGIKALWAFPEEHRYLLDRVVFGSFLDEVAQRRIPLFVRRSIGWPAIYRLLEQYPSLTLVVTAHGPWGEDRLFRPLLEHYANFYLDISRYELDLGIPDLVARYGYKKLLMGSNYPQAPMGGPRLMLAHCNIDEPARVAIAGGNIRRLLRKVELA